MNEKKCEICGNAFYSGYSKKKYCCAKCAIAAEKRRAQKAYQVLKANRETPMDKIKKLETQLEKCKAVMTDEQLIKAGL